MNFITYGTKMKTLKLIKGPNDLLSHIFIKVVCNHYCFYNFIL